MARAPSPWEMEEQGQRKSISCDVGGSEHLCSLEDNIRAQLPRSEPGPQTSLRGLQRVIEGIWPRLRTPGQVDGEPHLRGADLGTGCNGSSSRERLNL